MLSLQNCLSHNILATIDISYSNNVPALAIHFTHHLLKHCLNRLFKQIQSVNESEIHIFSSTAVRLSHGNLCHLIGRHTKHSQTKIEFVQTTGQVVMHASQWLKLEHCSSTSWRLHGPILPASVFFLQHFCYMRTDFYKRLRKISKLIMKTYCIVVVSALRVVLQIFFLKIISSVLSSDNR